MGTILKIGCRISLIVLSFGFSVWSFADTDTPPTLTATPITRIELPNLKLASPRGFSVATVNVAELLNRAPQAAAASDRLTKKYAPRNLELDKKFQELQVLEEQLLQLPEDERLQKERDWRSQKRNYDRDVEDYRAELRLARDSELTQVQKEIIEAINTVRIDSNIDVVLRENDYIVADPQVDITARVFKYLQQQFDAQVVAPFNTESNRSTDAPKE